jgi:hypothetical protein
MAVFADRLHLRRTPFWVVLLPQGGLGVLVVGWGKWHAETHDLFLYAFTGSDTRTVAGVAQG